MLSVRLLFAIWLPCVVLSDQPEVLCVAEKANQEGPYFDIAVNDVHGKALPFPAVHVKSFKELKKVFLPYNRAQSYLTYKTECSKYYRQPPKITDEDIANAYEYSTINLFQAETQLRLAAILSGNNVTSAPSQTTLQALYLEMVSRYLQEEKCLSKTSVNVYLPTLPLEKFKSFPPSRYGDPTCEYASHAYGERQQPSCGRHFPFRSFDGSCNNLEKPLQGAVGGCLRRHLPADYADGINALRVSASGQALPNPRLLSTGLLGEPDQRPLDRTATHLFAAFGQFLTESVRVVSEHSLTLNCCPVNGAPKVKSEFCAPVHLPSSDPWVKLNNQTCHNYIRASPCNQCSLGTRQFLNTQTPFFDLSNMYPVNRTEAMTLRTLVNGTLLADLDSKGHEIYPIRASRPEDGFDLRFCNGVPCLRNADGIRANSSPGRAALGVTILRRHNQHARALKRVNAHWSDERLFQEARALNIAEYQHIIYNEYMGVLLGHALMDYFDLYPRTDASYTSYQPDVSPQSWIEMSTSVFRFGHSIQNEFYDVLPVKSDPWAPFSVTLIESHFNVTLIQNGFTTGVIKGMVANAGYQMSPSVAMKDLFPRPGQPKMDLGVIDIQRGRDAGLPGYVHYVKYCFNYEAKTWSDLSRFMSCDNINRLKSFYDDVQDIDLFVGGLHERVLPDGQVGPTFACVLGIQFHNVKVGDRFYYEHGNQAGTMSKEQLENIRQRSRLANTLCQTTDLDAIQERPFEQLSHENPKIYCKSLHDIDYRLWQEKHKK
ncbi:Peroxidasin [Halotydeus destructor]|nr:Peroxidasin [Halotydeus destructor]